MPSLGGEAGGRAVHGGAEQRPGAREEEEGWEGRGGEVSGGGGEEVEL